MSNIDIYKDNYENRGGEIQESPCNNGVKVQVATGNAATLAKPFRHHHGTRWSFLFYSVVMPGL